MSKSEEQAACNGENDHGEDPVDTMDEDDSLKEKMNADPNKVKFTSVSLEGYDGKNGDAKVDIYVAQTTVGMGKEELMKYANEPFWVRLRMFLFVLFWIAWIAMLVGAVVIILLAPRCPPAPKLDWYQKSPMYEVDVETFKDSDGDGIGDFKGLISKLGYFKENNIGTLILSSFYEQSEDNAITNHKEIDEKLGTLADFEELVAQLEEKDIKLVVDFVPNHSSDKHQWFVDSKAGTEPYADYYVWHKEKHNNWINTTGLSAWYWNGGGYYFSTFGPRKPELNLRNVKVREEMKNILRFWLEKGVHGFRVKEASHLIEHAEFQDEPLATNGSNTEPKYDDLDHIYTIDQEENYDLFAEWRELLSEFLGTNGTTLRRILLAEVSGSLNSSLKYYGNGTQTLVDLPINPRMLEITNLSTGIQLQETMDAWSKNAPENAWPTLLLGGASVKRLASRVGEDLVDAMYMVATMAKGTPITYYGDELGMTDVIDQDGMMHQSVMLWSNETNAGFSSGDSGLKVHPSYRDINVMVQQENKQSHLNMFKRLLTLRSQPALGFGLQEYPVVNNQTFSMIRVRKGSPGYLVVINLSSTSTVVDFTDTSEYLPDIARVEIRSQNLKTGPLAESDHPKVYLNNIPLDGKQAVIFSFVPQFKG